MPTRSAISEYTRAWFWPIEPTPMTRTRIGAATRPPKRARDINARRTRGVVEGFIFVRAFGRVVRCFDGPRSGVRETREPAQRVLDDLVQGDPVLLRQRGMPAQVRPQAGALSATRARSTSERSRLLIRPAGASLEASQRLGRWDARCADGRARGREDRSDERDAAQEQKPVPRDDEGGLIREEPQIQVVRQGHAEGDAHRDSGQRDGRKVEGEGLQPHRPSETERSEGTGLLAPLDDVAHRDDAEAGDADDEAQGQVRLQEVEHAHRRLEDLVDELLDVQRDQLVRDEVPFQVVARLRHIDAGPDLEVEQARRVDSEFVFDEVGGDPEALDELLVQDPDDLDAVGRRSVPVVHEVADGYRESPEVGTEVVRDDRPIDEREARIRLDGGPSRRPVGIRRVESLEFERWHRAGGYADQAGVEEATREARVRTDLETGLDRLSVSFVMFFQTVCAPYVSKAALALAIGTPEAPIREKPPLSRMLVLAIDELTSAWIPDIVAFVNMTRAMLARVAPVRNFLFIGYAIAVRTTGRHVRRRTSRVASARIESLLKRTMRSPPRTSMRPAAMNSVMSAFAMLKNFQGLSTHPTMNAPAAVKTARAGRARMVRTATPNASPTGPRSWSSRFCRKTATKNPMAPRTTIVAPAAT